MVAIGLGVLGLAFAAPAILTFLNTMIGIFSAAVVLTVLGVLLFAIYMVLSNKKFQTLVSYMFKSAMRKLTGAFVEIDPIGIMRSYISDLKDKQKTMDSSIDKMRGQIKICERQVNQNEDEYNTQMATLKVARDKNMGSAATVAARQAGRLEKLNKTSLIPLMTQMKMHLKALEKYREVTDTVILDMENEVSAQEMQRKMMLESHSAMSTAKKILRGGTDQKELFDQAMEFTVQDYGMKMGEIENFIESSKGFVEGLDLQNGVYEEQALAKLQEWEANAESILLGSGKQQMLQQEVTASPLTHSIGVPAAKTVDYAKLIGRGNRD